MEAQTELAIRSLLAMEKSIDPETVNLAIGFLRGERPKAEAPELPRVIKYADVMKYLHVTRRTVDNYVQKGLLTKVFGGGCRALGIDCGSYQRFVAMRPTLAV